MTADELADKLENNTVSWGDCTHEQYDNDKYFKEQASAMLRQQAKEIEALKLRELTDEEIQEIGKPFLGYVTFDELDFARAILRKASEEIACNKCNDTGWVCEWHPDKEAHKCCGGAGMPCECIGGEK